MIYGTGSTLDLAVTWRLCYVELSTCSRDVISRGETWAARMHVWAPCDQCATVHPMPCWPCMARGWRARMCARLINSQYRSAVAIAVAVAVAVAIAIAVADHRANDKLEKASNPESTAEYSCAAVPSGRHVIVIKVA